LRLTINGDPGRVGTLNEWMVDHSKLQTQRSAIDGGYPGLEIGGQKT